MNNIKQYIQTFRTSSKDGFTLLFAVLVSILVLSVGTSIINLSVKQIILSGSTRESQYAFYAANTGIECVYYWDLNPPSEGRVFATSSDSISLEEIGEENDVQCGSRENGRSIYDAVSGVQGSNLIVESTEDSATTKFWITFEDLPYCAYVIVTKTYDNTLGQPIQRTQIDSYGYNTCDQDNPRRIERGLRVNY